MSVVGPILSELNRCFNIDTTPELVTTPTFGRAIDFSFNAFISSECFRIRTVFVKSDFIIGFRRSIVLASMLNDRERFVVLPTGCNVSVSWAMLKSDGEDDEDLDVDAECCTIVKGAYASGESFK